MSSCLSYAITVNFNENQLPCFEYPLPFHVYYNGIAFIEAKGGGSLVMILIVNVPWYPFHLFNEQSVTCKNMVIHTCILTVYGKKSIQMYIPTISYVSTYTYSYV